MIEHEIIKNFLIILNRLSDRMLKGEYVDAKYLMHVDEFISIFIIRNHHHKEEDILFKYVIDKGFPHEAGPLNVLTNEHRLFRESFDNLRDLIGRYIEGDLGISREIAKVIKNIGELLEPHIRKEEAVLFPILSNLLSRDDNDRIQAMFRDIDREILDKNIDRIRDILNNILTIK